LLSGVLADWKQVHLGIECPEAGRFGYIYCGKERYQGVLWKRAWLWSLWVCTLWWTMWVFTLPNDCGSLILCFFSTLFYSLLYLLYICYAFRVLGSLASVVNIVHSIQSIYGAVRFGPERLSFLLFLQRFWTSYILQTFYICVQPTTAAVWFWVWASMNPIVRCKCLLPAHLDKSPRRHLFHFPNNNSSYMAQREDNSQWLRSGRKRRQECKLLAAVMQGDC